MDQFYTKQKEQQILPIRFKFMHNSITLFYKIVNHLVPISLPEYISLLQPEATRYTRSTASVIDGSDTSTYVCSVVPNCSSFRNGFFHRTMLLWNALPAHVRQTDKISIFKTQLTKFFWSADISWPD